MNIPLTEEEKAGVGITKEWQANSLQAMNLRPGPDGSVQFTYGASMPSIVCAVLEVTDLQLQSVIQSGGLSSLLFQAREQHKPPIF